MLHVFFCRNVSETSHNIVVVVAAAVVVVVVVVFVVVVVVVVDRFNVTLSSRLTELMSHVILNK